MIGILESPKQVTFQGKKIAYYTFGKGPAVVLIHGYCEESFVFMHWSQRLSATHRVLCIDLPGFGKSEVHENAAVDFYWYAEAVRAVLQQEKIKLAYIGGHSMGGYTVLHLAEKFPGLFAGLLLINSHCYEDAPEKKVNREKTIRFVEKHGTRHFLQSFYPQLFATENAARFRPKIKLLHERGKYISPITIRQAAQAMLTRTSMAHVLSQLVCPVLMLCGARDTAVPRTYSLRMASLPRVCDFHLFENAGHMAMYESDASAFRALQEFLGRYGVHGSSRER